MANKSERKSPIIAESETKQSAMPGRVFPGTPDLLEFAEGFYCTGVQITFRSASFAACELPLFVWRAQRWEKSVR